MDQNEEKKVGVALTFTPKFNPYQKVKYYLTRKNFKIGTIVDCVAPFTFVVKPTGESVELHMPDESTIQYAITFDGNGNNITWVFEYELLAVEEESQA